MPALGNALGLPFRKTGLGFVGALDAYLTNLLAVYCENRHEETVLRIGRYRYFQSQS